MASKSFKRKNRAGSEHTWPHRTLRKLMAEPALVATRGSDCCDARVWKWPHQRSSGTLIEVRSMGHSGLDLLTLSFSHFDPERSLAKARQEGGNDQVSIEASAAQRRGTESGP